MNTRRESIEADLVSRGDPHEIMRRLVTLAAQTADADRCTLTSLDQQVFRVEASYEVGGPPDFVGIGVQKAGTTWWFELLLTHPDQYGLLAAEPERRPLALEEMLRWVSPIKNMARTATRDALAPVRPGRRWWRRRPSSGTGRSTRTTRRPLAAVR